MLCEQKGIGAQVATSHRDGIEVATATTLHGQILPGARWPCTALNCVHPASDVVRLVAMPVPDVRRDWRMVGAELLREERVHEATRIVLSVVQVLERRRALSLSAAG